MDKKKVEFHSKKKKKTYLNCEVAKTFFQKTKGLMNRKKLSENKGMLFIFLFPCIRFFWMKNVKIPLDIIFVDRKQRIIKIYEAPVEKSIFHKNYCSMGLCKYVIETNMGFCKKNNIRKNDRLKII